MDFRMGKTYLVFYLERTEQSLKFQIKKSFKQNEHRVRRFELWWRTHELDAKK